eukprot:g4838.t1
MVSCFKVLFLLVSLLVLVAAVLLQNMEAVVTKLVKLERRSPGLDKLRVGWTMAGGDDGGSEGMSLAIKSILWASVFGPPQTASRSSWQRLSRVLADADREWVSAHRGIGLGPDGPQEIAEGHRAISHILRLALEIFVEVHPSRPKFTRLVSPTMKLQGDNPDAIYMIAAVTQPSATAAAAAASSASSASLSSSSSSSSTQVSGYVVRGKKHAKEVYFSIALMGYLGDAGLANVVGDLNDSAMDFDPTTAPPFFSLVPNIIGKPAKWSKDSEGAGGVDIACKLLPTPKEGKENLGQR